MDYIGTHQKAKEAQGNPFDFSDKLQMFATLRMQKNALEAEKMKTQAEGEQRLFENAMKLKQLDLDTSKQEFEQIGMVFDHLEQTKDVESTQQFADQLGLKITLKDLNPENNIVKFTSETGDPNNPYVLFEGRARDVAAASSMANALMAAGNPKEQAMLAAATKNGVSITAVKDPNKNDKTSRVIYDSNGNPIYAEGTGIEGDEFIKASTREIGKGVAERVNKRIDAGFEATSQNQNLQLMLNAIDEGAQTGYGEESIYKIKSLAQTLGIDTGDLAGQEVIIKVASEMALRNRNPESGLGLTGNTSNKDLAFLKSSTAGLEKTEAGNRAIIKYSTRVNQMKIDAVKYQQKLIRENNGVPPRDLDEKIMDFMNSYELFSDDEKAEIETVAKAGKSGSPQTAEQYLKKFK